MEDDKSSPVRLIAFSQAWFEPFVVAESLPIVDAEWMNRVFMSLDAEMSGRAWLGRGPAQHPIGATAMLYFQGSDESYPVFSQPSLSPKGSSVRVAKVPRTVTTGENSAIFCIEVASNVPASREMFALAMSDTPNAESAQVVVDATRAARDTLIPSRLRRASQASGKLATLSNAQRV
jgi:hypothetical protein